NTFKLTANQAEEVNYQWFRNNILISGAVNFLYTVAKNSDGDYYATATGGNGCSANSNIVSLTNIKKPAANITLQGDPDICSTGSVTLQASGKSQYSYKWYKNNEKVVGEFNQALVVTTPGYYTVKVTENNAGCNKTSSPSIITSSCKVLQQDQENKILSLSVYPNPSNGHFFLGFYGAPANSNGKLEVMNMLGEIIYSENLVITANTFKRDVYLSEAQNGGIYIIRIALNGDDFSTLLSVVK
ncbi:MAG TPA: T9SS type A sorting domain-containing protein, partial [Chitinophagales bacterium]|nr:T9SS type A sorting domain-containing protein [Chitinophagales bacterium]